MQTEAQYAVNPTSRLQAPYVRSTLKRALAIDEWAHPVFHESRDRDIARELVDKVTDGPQPWKFTTAELRVLTLVMAWRGNRTGHRLTIYGIDANDHKHIAEAIYAAYRTALRGGK
ncbi:hypothetical protein [Streptomyces sp. URMC 125]|uniref:hypothetical protein n=1 Tax=Streptomyces sp. URMC 125 TaxID=3423419 RepID=UPI003F1ABA55